MNEAVREFDPVHGEEWTVPHSCPCCEKCRFVVKGKRAGTCVYGGPYKGYVEVPEST